MPRRVSHGVLRDSRQLRSVRGRQLRDMHKYGVHELRLGAHLGRRTVRPQDMPCAVRLQGPEHKLHRVQRQRRGGQAEPLRLQPMPALQRHEGERRMDGDRRLQDLPPRRQRGPGCLSRVRGRAQEAYPGRSALVPQRLPGRRVLDEQR